MISKFQNKNWALLSLGALFFFAQAPNVKADNPGTIVAADFTQGAKKGALGDGSMGVWKLSEDDPKQACEIETLRDVEGIASLAVDYKVASPEPKRSKVGLWMTLGKLDLRPYNVMEIEMMGDMDRGFPRAIRVELKRPNPKDEKEMIWASWKVEGIEHFWKTFEVPLDRMNGITDWSDVRELVITFIDRMSDQKSGRLYIRKITFKKSKKNGLPWTGDHYTRSRYKATDKLDGQARAEAQVKRLGGFPQKAIVQKEFPQDDKEFLKVVAQDTWKFFDQIVDKETGLPLDNITIDVPNGMGPRAAIGDYTNITNVGLYFACLPAAEDLGLITHQEAQKRALRALNSLKKMESFKGIYYNYYDTTTLERTTHFVSSVDTGWLLAGLIMLRNAYPGDVAKKATKIIDGTNLKFFYDPVEREIFHGYYKNIEAHSEYHYGSFYTEARATSFIGIAKGDMPAEHWFALARTFPPEWKWQSQSPRNREVKEAMGCKFYGGTYNWNGEAVVPSWGGSMFEALLPPLIIDEDKFSPKALGLNNLRHAKAQKEYAQAKSYPVWGMSPSSDGENGYGEFGVKPMGLKGYPDGVVTPHASCIALPYIFNDAVANLREMIKRYPIYGEYGFYDALKLDTGNISYKYLALDQAMSFLGIANALNPGKIHQRFHNDPLVKNGEALLKAEPELPN